MLHLLILRNLTKAVRKNTGDGGIIFILRLADPDWKRHLFKRL